MEIRVCDREEIERGLLVRTDYVVISIRDPGRPRAKVKPQCGLRDVLFLAFHDAEPSANFELPPEVSPTFAPRVNFPEFLRFGKGKSPANRGLTARKPL